MRIYCYLLVSHTGSIAVRKSRPGAGDIKAGQVVLPLTITIPQSAFTQYLASTEITVPESQQFQAAVELVEDEGEGQR